MKSLIIVMLISIFSTSTNAQKKSLLQQIAALKVYIDYAQKGYSIAKEGLTLIGDIKNGEFDLHSKYISSLKTINPRIRNYSKVADIISLQLEIIKVYKNDFRQVQQSKAFTADELNYINEVFKRLIDDCTGTIDELISITTSNNLEMKDDERLKRIDALYNDMQAKYTFVQSYAGEAKALAISRMKEQNDIETRSTINGIKN